MTLSIRTLSIMTLSITRYSIMTMTLSVKGLFATPCINDTQHK